MITVTGLEDMVYLRCGIDVGFEVGWLSWWKKNVKIVKLIELLQGRAIIRMGLCSYEKLHDYGYPWIEI
jgi:hypothetical protein